MGSLLDFGLPNFALQTDRLRATAELCVRATLRASRGAVSRTRANTDLANPLVAIVIGAAGSLVAAGLIRFVGGVGDFLPRRVDTLRLGSLFQPFRARGTGDNYDAVMWMQLRSLGTSPLFVVRAGFRNTHGFPVYVNSIVIEI